MDKNTNSNLSDNEQTDSLQSPHGPSEKVICNLRTIVAEMPVLANSGHQGAPMALVPLMCGLYRDILRWDPDGPDFSYRDRIVMSNGHASALLYMSIALFRNQLTIDDLKKFRQLHSRTPGHPERQPNLGIETTTGPLGQGIANAVGIAIASMKNHLNSPMVPRIFCIIGDGCFQEGVGLEALSFAATANLSNLIILFDDNGIQLDGPTNLCTTILPIDLLKAMGYHIEIVNDTESVDEISQGINRAIEGAQKSNMPALVALKTVIGIGAAKQGTSAMHGAGMKGDEVKEYASAHNVPLFEFTDETLEFGNYCRKKAREALHSVDSNVLKVDPNVYAEALDDPPYPPNVEQRKKLQKFEDICKEMHTQIYSSVTSKANLSGRSAANLVLKVLGPAIPQLIAGCADVFSSTLIKWDTDFFSANNRQARHIQFGVREHAMMAIANGISGDGLIPIVSTFLAFSTYGLPAIRLSALSNHHVIYAMTHDSIAVGEDGPTHQPIDVYPALRAIPNLVVLRPADAREVLGSFYYAICYHGPTLIALSRQDLPLLESSSVNKTLYGAYEIIDHPSPDVILVATGSEVSLACKTAEKMKDIKIRIVSMPSWDLFELQPLEYRQSLLGDALVVSVEASPTQGWERYSHASHSINTFGFSAPPNDVMMALNMTTDGLEKTIREALCRHQSPYTLRCLEV